MVVLCVEPTDAGDALLASLPPHLHFMSFAFRLPTTSPDGRVPTLDSWRDDVHEVIQWLVRQSPMLSIRALVGHGAAADACHSYASRYGEGASCPLRQLCLISGSHSSSRAWPPGGWKVLSLLGSKDGSSRLDAEAFHVRHERQGHTMRIIEGAGRDFKSHELTLAKSINDFLEGARRLNGDDRGLWSSPAARSGGGGGPQPQQPPNRAPAAAVAEPSALPIGSMERVREIQLELMADDLPVDEQMVGWSEARLREYFESGGVDGGQLV
jgi:hypothetical protein